MYERTADGSRSEIGIAAAAYVVFSVLEHESRLAAAVLDSL